MGVEIISTGGTLAHLRENGIPALSISDVTGFPEILDGRVKTLHPSIHGGLLARRSDPAHLEQIGRLGIAPIDLVVVNLYPFEETVRKDDVPLAEAIEQIDIGGPSMLRSAAKNHEDVVVICDPEDYAPALAALKAGSGDIPRDMRLRFARKAFERTAAYDAAIAAHLAKSAPEGEAFPASFAVGGRMAMPLRYGENPHQQAALYGDFSRSFEKLHGKELSFNNIVDMQAAAELAAEFSEPAAAIIKHTNPCGCAVGATALEAYTRALTADPVSAYGGIVAVNREVDAAFAGKLNEIFLEVVIAPAYTDEALELLRKKRDRRLILARGTGGDMPYDLKLVRGGFLLQTRDVRPEDPAAWKVVTKRAPTAEEREALAFAWKVAKHVKSNAIVYTNAVQALGVGAGQMSRVDSSMLAAHKARAAGLDLRGSVVASDAYFPFADGLLEAVRAGSTAVVEPGGSVRDAEVIAAADEHGIAMLFTGIRHFKH